MTRASPIGLIGLICLTLALGTACESKTTEAPPEPGSTAEWRPVDIEGLLTVDFPGQPKEVREELPNPNGSGTMMSVSFTTPATNDLPFVGVSVKTFPVGQKLDPKGAFEGGRDNALRKLRATLVSEKDCALGDYPGREFVLSTVGPNGALITKNRVYVMGQSIVTITTAAPEGSGKESVELVFASLSPSLK